jgi:hypothetical protein
LIYPKFLHTLFSPKQQLSRPTQRIPIPRDGNPMEFLFCQKKYNILCTVNKVHQSGIWLPLFLCTFNWAKCTHNSNSQRNLFLERSIWVKSGTHVTSILKRYTSAKNCSQNIFHAHSKVNSLDYIVGWIIALAVGSGKNPDSPNLSFNLQVPKFWIS